MSDTRRIKCAAIRKNGVIHEGKNHGEIFASAKTFGGLSKGEQGFVTERGEFVDRYEALRIAEKADQIRTKHHPINRLLSEDLKQGGE